MSKREAWIDTLRLSNGEREQLLAELERQMRPDVGHDLRGEPRVPYRVPAGLVVRMDHPGGSAVDYLVRPRNLSRCGVGFLHGGYLHENSRCRVLLRHVNGKMMQVEGHVAWCRFVQGRIHEVGVKFNTTIDTSAFLDNMIRTDEKQQQSVELPRLCGRVLYVEDSIDDQALLRFHLTNMGVTVDVAADALAGLEQVERHRPHLVVTGYWLPGMSGSELAEALRGSGYDGPILLLTSESNPRAHAEAITRGCTGVLTKPYLFEDLVRAISRHLPAAVDPVASPLLSQHWDNVKMRPMILEFLSRLERQVQDLAHLIEQDEEPQLIAKRLLDLKGSCGGYGFPQIGELAAQLHGMISKGLGAERQKVFEQLQQLVTTASRARDTPSAPAA